MKLRKLTSRKYGATMNNLDMLARLLAMHSCSLVVTLCSPCTIIVVAPH